jgi:ribosomal protein L37E
MGEKTNCPRCDGKLVWNGTTMACLACSYTAPTKPAQPKSEKKFPFPRKNKKG